ncbi:uncharacterized protein STEHIDRAFT_121213 [Stereum hirsutum FP-91666 SS1]|uniref:uncharacterized protein n=1 Tax=Stereum hirsutum (strain FP-91666) TaxID=721885 RepID=UPI000440C085|nr:uncharacterized protein STEHIDRAFT_121213 [Stereum hirsutum FP-91666 SS1]EIM87627.1 hypothetical protein STEHIDRAFT_121213 [Stereum hirsutum FP-91666 SS1]
MAESTPASGWTVGVMYILPARLWYSGNAPPVPMSFIAEFCRRFDQTQARLVADRVTPLARGIVYRAEALGNIKLAIPPLHNLLSRYAPSLSYLTTIHPIFLTACVQTKSYTAALPVLSTPITEISNSTTPSPYSPGSESASSQVPLSPDLTYQDHLIYHYLGGIALAALKKFKLAEEFFEICASAPVGLPSSSSGRNGGGNNGSQGNNAGGASEGASGSGRGGAASRFGASSMNVMAPMGRGSGGAGGGGDGGEGRGGGNGERGERGGEASMLQLDAMKKLVLVQLILYGQSKPPPRYTFPTITNSIRNSVYGAFAKVYPGPSRPLMQIVNKEGGVFDRDENAGLVKQALSRAPRWAIKKLTETYLTLGLREIGAAVGVGIPSNATPVTGGDGGEGEGSGASKEVKWKSEDVDVEIVRGIVLDMIEHKEINASISADDTVTFADDIPLQVSKSDVDRALAEAQRQEALLREVEGALGRSRDWLAKAMRSRDEPGGLSTMMNTSNMGMQEDDLMSGIMGPGGSGTWDD